MKRCNTKLLLFAVCLLLGGFLVNGLMGLNSQIASASTDYTVDYVVNSDWGSGASVNVTIKNTGASEINGWKLEWTFSGNQKVISAWNGSLAQTESAVTVSNMAYNAVIPAKGSVSFGFTLSYSGTNSKPTSFTLNNNVIASPSATPVLTPTPTATATSTATPVPSSSSDVLYIGRFDTSDAAGPKFAWSASTIKAKFAGTSISVNLKSAGDNWFNVVIDGVVKTPVNIGPSTAMPVLLASGLASGNHTVELVKRTEAWVGDVQFLGFSVGGGKLLAPPAAAARRIEFIGDSITCGYGNEGASQYQSFTVKNENAYLAYGSIAARALEADQITVAWSGKGLVHNYGGDTTDLMSQVYSRVLPYNTTLTWDAKKWTPQVVVINLGTNDFSTYPPTTATFTAAYLSFVKKIRNQYSNAHIYCAVGPMLGWDGLLTAKESINAVIAQFKAAGDTKVHFIEFPTQDGTLGYGEDWHPSLATHAQMAEILVERLETDLGW